MAKSPAKNTKAPAKPAAAAAASEGKSIINPKYKDKYKDPATHDQLVKLLNQHATLTKDVKVTVTEGDEKVTKTEKRAAGVNVDALFTIAKMNNIDVSAYEKQRDGHGFPGRFRMTVANMLRSAMAKRHGLFMPDANGKPSWVAADDDFKSRRSAPEKPTHNRDGTKIAPPKAEKAKEPAAAEA